MAQFDDHSSRSLVQASAQGKIKWFNATKGYGFVTLDNGDDAFCHASTLQAVGHAELPQGARVVCDLADSQRGLQVVAVHSVDLSTAEPARSGGPRRDPGDRFGGRDFGAGNSHGGHSHGGHGGYDTNAPSGPMVEGRIKFFNDQKGFGFVMPDAGSGDVYLHASALRRSGVQTVEPEQRIRYCTRQGAKGVEVDKVELI